MSNEAISAAMSEATKFVSDLTTPKTVSNVELVQNIREQNH